MTVTAAAWLHGLEDLSNCLYTAPCWSLSVRRLGLLRVGSVELLHPDRPPVSGPAARQLAYDPEANRLAVSWDRAAGAQDVGLAHWGFRGRVLMAWRRGRGGNRVMGDKDGRCQAVSDLEHSERPLCHKAVGPLRLLLRFGVLLRLRDPTLLGSLAFIWLLPGLNGLLDLLCLSPADVVDLPGALERIKELIQTHISLHELLQQLLGSRTDKQSAVRQLATEVHLLSKLSVLNLAS